MTAPRNVPQKPALEGLEAKWDEIWEANGTYRFDRTATRDQVYSIDTPPPTVSGSLHVGHMFSYTHCDTLARYQRMQGKQVYYPMGWDDNGLPTERRVQNYFGVRCDPVPALRPRIPAPRRARQRPDPHLPAQLRRAVRAAHRHRRAGLRGALAPPRLVHRLVAHLRHHRRAQPPGLPAGIPPQPGPGRGLPERSPQPVGRHLPHRSGPGRTGRPGAPRCLPPLGLPSPRRQRPAHRHHPPRAAGRLRCCGGPPRRPALPAPCSAKPSPLRCSRRRCLWWPTPSPTPKRAPGRP